MTRAEMLGALTEYPVTVSVDGSAPMPLTAALAVRLYDGDADVRVLDLTVLPMGLREHFKDDGTFDGRKVRD